MPKQPRKRGLLARLRNRLGTDPYCTYCHRTLTDAGTDLPTAATRDHTIPVCHGGDRTVPCCQACNGIKADMTLGEWNTHMARNPEWWLAWRHGYVSRGGLPKVLDKPRPCAADSGEA